MTEYKTVASPGDPFTDEWKRDHPNYKDWHDRFLMRQSMHLAAQKRAAVERARREIPLDDKHSVLAHDGGSESGAVKYSKDRRSATMALPRGAVGALTKIRKRGV